MLRDFVRLHEYNDHEGERWNWWLQVTGNEQEIAKLAHLLDDASEQVEWDLDYDLTSDIESEQVVDILALYAEQGYYAAHNKVTGKFTCPDDLGEDQDRLYKGRICDFFDKTGFDNG